LSGLEGLSRKELIRRAESTQLAGQEAYRFVHILIRDAAYGSLLKRARAELHERFVDWLERVATERVMEYEEIRGYHLEQAYLTRAELGPVDEHARTIGIRGSGYLASAGHRALARGDMPAAANLLQRAASLIPSEAPGRARLDLAAGEALIETGDFVVADERLTDAIEGAARLGDRGLETTARLSRLRLRYTTEPEQTEPLIAEEVERAIPMLEELGDHAGLSRAWRLVLQVNFTAGRYGAAEAAALRLMDHARQAGDPMLEARFLPSLGSCVLYGPTPVPVAVERCRELLERAGGDRRTEAIILCTLAHLVAMLGSADEARDLYRRSRAMLQELGWRFHAALTSIDSGAVEMLIGDPAAAERELRGDLEVLREMGERDYEPTVAALLSQALYQQGRLDEADGAALEAGSTAAPEDVFSQHLWRAVHAKVLATRGDNEAAAALAEEAVRLIAATDDPDSLGNAQMDLAEVYELGGRAEDAGRALEHALRAFEAKGNTVAAARAQKRLRERARST
jgi:tetratricopeptide (TPR) repeat protein